MLKYWIKVFLLNVNGRGATSLRLAKGHSKAGVRRWKRATWLVWLVCQKLFLFAEAATTKVEDSEGNSGSGTTEVVESEESGSSEESGESDESGDWEESGESGESGDYEDSEESGDSNISKRDEIPKEQGRYTQRLC